MTPRTIVIGNPHGCLKETEQLLDKLKFKIGYDELYFLGDFLDRGPDPVGVVRLARRLGAKAVMGNHELKHINFKNRTTKKFTPDWAKCHKDLSDGDWEYLENLPPFYWLENDWLVVHAGFESNKVFYKQSPDIVCRVRWLTKYGSHSGKADKEKGTVHWTEKWEGPQNVVYGHFVWNLDYPVITEPVPGVFCYGIDTGCCFGGHLTALVLETKEIVQVKAERAYAVWREPRE